MRAPVDTNALPPDLAARFAALRAPSSPPAPPTCSSKQDPEEETDALAARLARLETPRKGEQDKVRVEVRTPPATWDGADEDPLAAFLRSSASSASAPFAGSSTSPSRPPWPPRTALPTPSSSALDTLSGIEVEFMRPSFGAAVGDLGGEGGTTGEEEELMRRMGEEAQLEERVRGRDEEGVGRWEKRLEGLRGVAFGSGGAAGTVPTAGRGGGVEGAPPELGELERALRKQKKKRGKRTGEGSSDEDEDGETSSEEEDSEEEDSEEEDSEER
ncbi:hypothetical protein JCM10207_005537 [Rhodosporidiobolus poonsookiae]